MIVKHLTAMSLSQKIGLGLLLALASFAGLEPLLSQYSPYTQDLSNVLAAPGEAHVLGSDQFGRSMLARLGEAVRLSFGLSIISVLTAAAIGTGLGVWAAWAGGLVDRNIHIVVNILLALPGLVVVLLFAAIVPGSFFIIYLAIALVQWIEYFRVVRAITLSSLSAPELQASAMLGFGPWYLFKRHVWPKLAQPILTLAAFGAAHAILTMASIGFVYVGLQPPTAELGLMIVELFPYYHEAPWALAQPLVVVAAMVLGFNLLAGKSS
ncbi:ABC transporter permease [Paraferrimonas sedimenticola]|uniref:ABC transporter permease n=1 Tax=Paraferrimonas sedimenticola TaxID=375674 RepID=A0AA37VV53_9GAMM|nr:ABC transporter permease [Paraferrimonas sedimenticola]GLP96039.1 ABC transporter permease [Paraferrimonas sedimenticola]